MSNKNNTSKIEKQKLLRAVYRGGHANEVMGWLWLVNGVYWAFLYLMFSSPHSSNPIIGLASVVASFSNGTLLLVVILSVILGVAHIGIGIYVKKLQGPKTTTLLLIGGIAAAIFFLSIIPAIAALFSLYGYYAARKVGRLAKPKSFKSLQLVTLKKRIIAAATLIVLALGLSLIASVRLHQYNAHYDAPGGDKVDKQTAIRESNESYSSEKIVGYCAVTPPPTVGCQFTSKDDGFTATFPANSAFAGTPNIHYDSKHRYADNAASAKRIRSITGYEIDVLYFRQAITGSDNIQQRLHASAGDKNLNVICTYDTSSDATQEIVTPTTYNGSQALNVYTSGTEDFQNKPCHYYSLAFMKGNNVYVLSATAVGSDKDEPTQDSFNKFVASFELK